MCLEEIIRTLLRVISLRIIWKLVLQHVKRGERNYERYAPFEKHRRGA